MNLQSIGIIGHGSFGAFLVKLIRRFAPSLQVRVYSRHKDVDGETFFSLEEVCQSDAVIFAVPISVFEETLVQVLPLIGEQTVLVDVATIKMHTLDVLKKHASSKRYLSTHPMFGPESYIKRGEDVTGFRIIVTEHTLEDSEFVFLTSFLTNVGFDIANMSAEKHDRHLAETLFLTHFIGQTIHRAGFERTEIDSVSFGFLMDAVESVRNDTALFEDVFRFNPFCKDTLDRLQKAEQEVYRLLEAKSDLS